MATSVIKGKVSKTGDTMSGMLNINQTSGDTGVTTKRTDKNVSAFFGVGAGGSAHGVYSNTAGKWLVNANSSGNIYLNGIDFSTAKTGSNALINALDPASATIIDSTPIITGGNVPSLENVFYRRSASGIKNYIGEQLTNTSLITTESTMTATVTPANKYDSHGTLEKFGRVCTLDLNCDYSASYSAAYKIGTIPEGYRPRVKHSYNITTNYNTPNQNNPYIQINTNGDVNLGNYTGGTGFRAVLTWVTAL